LYLTEINGLGTVSRTHNLYVQRESAMIDALIICSLGAVIGYGLWVQWKTNRDQNKINEIVFDTIKIHAETIKKHTAALKKDARPKETDPQNENLPA
jgi:hypothetical protein